MNFLYERIFLISLIYIEKSIHILIINISQLLIVCKLIEDSINESLNSWILHLSS